MWVAARAPVATAETEGTLAVEGFAVLSSLAEAARVAPTHDSHPRRDNRSARTASARTRARTMPASQQVKSAI